MHSIFAVAELLHVVVVVVCVGRVVVCLWQARKEDLERELSKLNEKDAKLEEDKNKIAEQYKQEYMELKTDRDATIEQLKGV